jgi:methylated-DNA-[protein]-cysteine S-methyltransferase
MTDTLSARLAHLGETLADAATAAPRFDSADIAYAVSDTPIGRLLYAVTDAGALVAALFAPDDTAEAHALERVAAGTTPRILRLPRRVDEVRREFDDFLEGRREGFDLPLDDALMGPFQRQVLRELAARVGYGERSTYGALARALGRPTASRAVGAALGANPLCVVLPCHRIVSSTGSLTGYAGGLPAKQYLLDLETRHTRLV